MTADLDVLILDPATGETLGRCTGPAPDGTCPQARTAHVVACAGCAIVPARGRPATPYPVPGLMTVCPVAWALDLAGSPDTAMPSWEPEPVGVPGGELAAVG